MSYNNLLFEQKEHVGVLTINRPEAMNAFNKDVFAELEDFCDDVDNISIRCLVITGAGDKAFVAGTDIKELQDIPLGEGADKARLGQRSMQMIEDLSVPVIAAVNGYALGGGLELALACDFIIASSKARLGLPEVSLGLIPGYGGTQRLSRSIGINNARRMTLTGEMITAEQGLNMGLISDVVEPGELLQHCIEIGNKISKQSASAIELARQGIKQGADLGLQAGIELEAVLFGQAMDSDDKQEGVAAFIEKRKPNFK